MATSKVKNNPSIVEQGVSGMWHYRKWSDGIAECWGYKNVSATWSQWSGSALYYIQAEPDNYPSEMFREVQCINGQLTTNGGDSISSIVARPSDLSIRPPRITAIRPGVGVNPAVGYAYWHCIGRWKVL